MTNKKSLQSTVLLLR